jgi:hypothetical protein
MREGTSNTAKHRPPRGQCRRRWGWRGADARLTTGIAAGILAASLSTAPAWGAPAAASQDDAHPQATKATATAAVIRFNPASVGVAASSTQTLTASFKVSGYTGIFTPTAVLHYGLSYSAGKVACTGSGDSETCTVPITFRPAYPGGRRDALFLMNGSTRLATVLLYGVGEGPLALVQPGSLLNQVNSTGNGNNSYFDRSVTEEDGTVWSIGVSGILTSVNKSGVYTNIPIEGLNDPQAIAIDGAGVIYMALNSYNSSLLTYDTVRKVAGSFPLPVKEYFSTVGAGDTGNVYAVDTGNNVLYSFPLGGATIKTTLESSPSGLQYTPLSIAVDAQEDLFFGAYSAVDELAADGVQKQLNPNAGKSGIAVDAAKTLYVPFYQYGTAELLATDYAALGYNFKDDEFPAGVSIGPDGTLNVGAGLSLLQYVRSKGSLAFSGNVGATTEAQTTGIYNAGNDSLTIKKITLTGAAFAMAPVATDECKAGMVIKPAASCQVAVTYTAPHAGSLNGNLAIESTSLNAAAAVTDIALTGTTEGVYIVPSPAVLAFSYQAKGTTSAAKTVRLTNQGYGQEAFIGQPTSNNPAFSVKLNTCTSAVQVGASCQLSVTFSPSVQKTYSATVTVPTGLDGGGTGPAATFTAKGSALPRLTLAIDEGIDVSDGTPTLTPATVLNISEAIHVSDGSPTLTPATVLTIYEAIHVSDGKPALTK